MSKIAQIVEAARNCDVVRLDQNTVVPVSCVQALTTAIHNNQILLRVRPLFEDAIEFDLGECLISSYQNGALVLMDSARRLHQIEFLKFENILKL